jgi:nucleotide-binding universal stress UspA family protein
MRSEVIAVYAFNVPILFEAGYAAPTVPVQYDPEWREEMRKEFEESWCRPLKDASVRYRAVMEDGRPASVITKVADQVEADLIIVGRRGRGGVAELLLGSVSHELVQHSKRPVLVVSSHP